MAGINCAVTPSDAIMKTLNEKFSVVLARLKNYNVDTHGLTKEEVLTALSKIMTETGYTLDTALELVTYKNTSLLNDVISRARIKKQQEKQAMENNKIGNATFVVGEKFDKAAPRKNRDTLYIFTDNLQASNVAFGEEIGDVIEVEGGVTMKVGATSALVRTDSNGDLNQNAVGLVTKKNAQNKKGVFINEEGNFKDNKEDYEAFVAANQRTINHIKELIFGEDSPYTKISMVDGLATEKASLPQRFAEKLQEMLRDELGIQTQLIPNEGSGFGLKVMKMGKQTKAKKEALDKASKMADEVISSLLAVRPDLPTITADPAQRSLLSQLYPNIEQRMARVSYISERFSNKLTKLIEEKRARYAKIPNRNADQEALYVGLTTGTEAEQRVFALGHFTDENGDPIALKFLREIQQTLRDIASNGSSKENIERFANELLAGKGSLGADFLEELYARGLDEDLARARRFAYQRARYLVAEYAKMAENDTFNALANEAAAELEFLENIRLDISKTPIETIEESEEDKIEEEKENANREGYMVKYKLMDPAKSLSIRMKTLLGSLYQRSRKNSSMYVFNDLGGRVRMDALTAYRILLEEFSGMKSPDMFAATLDRAIEKYPWLAGLKDRIIYNPMKPTLFNEQLRNEFFTTVRKAQVPYGMVSDKGLLVRLNRNSAAEDILENVRSNYEGRVVLGDFSIYDETGELNIKNLVAIDSLFNAIYSKRADKQLGSNKSGKKLYTGKKSNPLGWALKQLRGIRNQNGTVANAIEALEILAGVSEEVNENINLEAILRNIGIDTSNMDLDTLFGDIPYLDEEELSVIKTLDDLAAYITPKQVQRLISILEGIQTIVNQTSAANSIQPGEHLVTKFQSSYIKIGSALTIASDGYTAMTFRHAGAMRASYAAPDFISDLVGIINNVDSIEEANKWIEENYGQFDFYRDPSTKEWLNTWLENFFYQDNEGNYPYRKYFKYMNVLSFMGSSEDNLVGNVTEENLMRGIINAFFCGDSEDWAWYRSPLFSDVDACVLMHGKRYRRDRDNNPVYRDEIAKGLAKVIRQEYERIVSILTPKEGEQIVDIEFFNSGKNNGAKFQYFPELNERFKEIQEIHTPKPGESATQFAKRRDEALEAIAKEIVSNRALEFIEGLTDSDKLSMYKQFVKNQEKKNKQEEEQESEKVILEQEEEEELSSDEKNARDIARMNELLDEFFWNDFFAQSQIQQLLGGDLAYYKNFTDFVKRNKQAYACGERLFARETDAQGNITGIMYEKVMYLEDENVMTSTFSDLQELLMGSELSDADKRVMKFALDSFKKICSTDGQSFRTMDSFKKIFKAKGAWTDDMEIAYQNIKKGQITARDFLALWNPIKPFYFGHENIRTNGRNEKVTTQHKNSEYMITALYSFLNTALNKSPKLVGLQKFMEAHNIDVVHFHSVVKEGYNSPFDLNYNKDKFDKMSKEGKVSLFGEPFKGTYKEYISKAAKALESGEVTQEEFNEARQEFEYQTADEVFKSLERQSTNVDGTSKDIMFKSFSLENYMIVQPSGDHLIDDEAIFGTQLKNIIMADLPDDFSITVNLNGREEKLNREEAVKFYNSLLVDNLLDAFSKINDEFTSIEKLQKALFAKMENNPQYGDDVKAALQINESGTGFMLPFNSPTLSNKIESLMLSTFKNAIQRQKIKGGNAVLVSNFGLHEDLKVKYKNDDKKQGVEYIEAYLPATSSSMFKDFLVPKGDYMEIDFNKMKKALGEAGSLELLDIIGYRIPTEDKYSIMPIRVKGFMPVTAGATIMLPADIITMSGTDFDIDKLFLMIKEFDRITYPASLKDSFKQWVEEKKSKGMEEALGYNTEEEVEAALAEESTKYLGAEKLMSRKREGYTDNDIEKLLDRSELFEIFMEEVGYSLKYETPMYKILRPEVTKDMSLDEVSQQSNLPRGRRMAIRNNMLIDMIRGTLTNPEVSKLLMQPGNFDRVKHSSRQQKIMHNPKALAKFMKDYAEEIADKGMFTVLQGLDTGTLDKFFEENASPISPLDVRDYVKMQRNLMDGNALIGMFAVNSSNHYKLQFMDVPIADGYQLTINGVTFDKVDLKDSPMTGERVGRINAEFQAASPDNGKDPCLGDMGANTKTASRIGFLARLGLEPEMIGILNTADDFTDFGGAVARDLESNKIKVPGVKGFDLDMNKLTELIAKYRVDPKGFAEKLSAEDAMFAARFYKFMKAVKALSKSLNGVSKVSRSDSPNGALPISIPETLQKYFAVQDFIRDARAEGSPIKNLDKLVNTKLDASDFGLKGLREKIMESPVPRLQAAYTLGIKSAITMCERWFPGLSSGSIKALDLLRDEIQEGLTYDRDTTTVRRFVAELTMALLSRNSIFSDSDDMSIMDKRNYYIHDFPMKFKQFKEAKDKEGNPKYPEVINLSIIKRITNLDKKGLKFRNVGKISDRSRKHFVEELESLLYSDKPEVVELALDLFMYSYYDNGFQFGHSNFGIFFTTTYMQAMPKFIESLNEGNASLKNGNFNFSNYVYQHLMNHPEMTTHLRPGSFVIQGGKLKPKGNRSEDRIAFAKGADRTGDPVMLLNAAGKLWVKSGEGDNLHYTEIKYNESRIPFYDMTKDFSEIEWSELKERGRVGEVNKTKLKKALNEEETEENLTETKEKEDNIGEAPQEVEERLPDAPQEEDDGFDRNLIPTEDLLGDPADLVEMSRKVTDMETKLSDMAKRLGDLEMSLEALQAPQDEVKDSLDKYTPTEDKDLKTCE